MKGNEILLNDVEYFTQRDNKKDPFRTCYSTSMAMAMNYLLKTIGKSRAHIGCCDGKQLEDFIYEQIYSEDTKKYIRENISKYGRWILPYFNNSLQLTAAAECYVFNKFMRDYGYKAEYKEGVSRQTLEELLRFGLPQVLHGNYKSTSSIGGHIVCLVGLDEEGLFVHDPYGDAMKGYRTTKGDFVKYPDKVKYYDKNKYTVTQISFSGAK